MKKGKIFSAVFCGIILISLAGCGNQPVPIQPGTDETVGTAMTESSSVPSRSSNILSDQPEQTKPTASETGSSVPYPSTKQEESETESSVPTSSQKISESRPEQTKPPKQAESSTVSIEPNTPTSAEPSRPTKPEPDAPTAPPQTEESKPAKPTEPPVTEPADPVYTQADYDRIIREATAYAESYAEKGFTFEWKDSMEFGWDVGYMGTPRIKYEGVAGTISRLKNHIDKIVETGTNPAYGIPSNSVTYKVVQITIDGDIAFAVIYGG